MTEMRTFDIPYVKNGYMPSVSSVPLEEMSLPDITKKYLRTCTKSNGRVSECMRCNQKCVYGEKAIAMTYGLNKAEDVVPYEGSLLYQARMQNEQRRKEAEKPKEAEKQTAQVVEEKPAEKKRRANQDPEGWFEEAMAQTDPVQYVMDRFGKTRTQAKKKIYMYRYLHKKSEGEIKEETASDIQTDSSSSNDLEAETAQNIPSADGETEQKKAAVESARPESDDELLKTMMDHKLELLMNQQEQIESEIKVCQTKLTKVKEQIETICKTMDILKEV